MKKYILYEDIVYEIKINEEDKKNNIINYYYIQTSPHTRLLFTRNELREYKRADTIEELCEEFVFEGVDEKPFLCDDFSELLYCFNYSKKQQYTTRNCYGAIWTSKGLLYVAKLNDKGELELI